MHSRVLAYDNNGDVLVATYKPVPTAPAAGKGNKRKNTGDVVPTAAAGRVDYSRTSVISTYDTIDTAAASVTHAFNIGRRGDTGEKPIDVTSAPTPGAFCACVGLEDGFAIGGKENDLKIYDLSSPSSFDAFAGGVNTDTPTCVWRAKNVPHDNLSLRHPVWITDVKLRYPVDCGNCSVNGAQLVTGTAYKQIRVYDTKAKRQVCILYWVPPTHMSLCPVIVYLFPHCMYHAAAISILQS